MADTNEEGKITLRSVQAMELVTQKATEKLRQELLVITNWLGEYQDKYLKPFEVKFDRRDKDKIDFEIEKSKHQKEGNATKFVASQEKFEKINKELQDELLKLFEDKNKRVLPIARKV